MKDFKKFSIAAVLFISIISGICANGAQDEKAEGEEITLTIWYHEYGTDSVSEGLDRYAEIYEAAHPGVNIEWS